VRHDAPARPGRDLEVGKVDHPGEARIGPGRMTEVGGPELGQRIVDDGAGAEYRYALALPLRRGADVELDANRREALRDDQLGKQQTLALESSGTDLEDLRRPAARDAVVNQHLDVARQQLAAELGGQVVGDPSRTEAQERGTVEPAD